MTNNFEVEINGNKEIIQIKDDLTWGEVQGILKQTADISNPQAMKVNIQLYQQLVFMAAVIKAPFDPKNITELNNLPSKTVAKIMNEVMKQFPLEKFVQPWITAMTGQDSIESLMKSMSGAL